MTYSSTRTLPLLSFFHRLLSRITRQFAKDYFNNLPDELVAKVFRFLLAENENRLTKCSQLHLVCRRWHSVCISWAEHLPKRDTFYWFCVTDDGWVVNLLNFKNLPKYTNYNGLGGGPKLMDMLRHFNIQRAHLLFENASCTDAVLLQLIKNQLTHCSQFTFNFTDMSSVTDDVLTTFFEDVANSNCNIQLSISNVKSPEGVFTDRSLAPIMASNALTYFDIYMYNAPPESFIGITNETFTSLAVHLPQMGFKYELYNKVPRITANGFHHLIEKFCSPDCCVEADSYLTIPGILMSELLRLRTPDEIIKCLIKDCRRFDDQWIYKRLPSHRFPTAQLFVDFIR